MRVRAVDLQVKRDGLGSHLYVWVQIWLGAGSSTMGGGGRDEGIGKVVWEMDDDDDDDGDGWLCCAACTLLADMWHGAALASAAVAAPLSTRSLNPVHVMPWHVHHRVGLDRLDEHRAPKTSHKAPELHPARRITQHGT